MLFASILGLGALQLAMFQFRFCGFYPISKVPNFMRLLVGTTVPLCIPFHLNEAWLWSYLRPDLCGNIMRSIILWLNGAGDSTIIIRNLRGTISIPPCIVHILCTLTAAPSSTGAILQIFKLSDLLVRFTQEDGDSATDVSMSRSDAEDCVQELRNYVLWQVGLELLNHIVITTFVLLLAVQSI